MKKLITLNETVEVLERLVSSKQISRTKAFNMLLDHKRFLDQPLTKEMFEGDEAIFVGFRKGNSLGVEYYSNGVWIVYINEISESVFVSVKSYSLAMSNYFDLKNLHDLAELTKENQLEKI